MRAFISGQAALAVLVDGDRVRSFELDAAAPVVRAESELPLLFGGCSDVRRLDCDSEQQVLVELEMAWRKDRSLHMMLLVLDAQENLEIRVEAAQCLEDYLSTQAVADFVVNRLYSAPLPDDADLAGATELSEALLPGRVKELLAELAARQSEIVARCKAWSDLPDVMFGTLEDRERFKAAAVDAGAFRLFVTEQGRSDRGLFQLLVHPLFRGSALARRVFQAWAAPFKESIENVDFAREEADGERAEFDSDTWAKDVPGHEMFQQVQKQKAAIKEQLRKGNRALALRFTKQLVDAQRRNSEKEHLAKSLCDLAAFAKRLGDNGLQLDLSLWATKEVPEDAWSHGQLGDAYRSLGDYDRALDEFATAGALGHERNALLGRAEVLKDLGQAREALAIYQRCVETFPQDRVSRNGWAAAFATFGRFQESLHLYDELSKDIPADVVSLSGRAEVLRDMGRLEEALRELDSITSMFPDAVIPACARGEVLRELGRFDDALAWFQETAKQFPLGAEPRNGVARVLKELGLLEEALAAYRETTIQFPLDQHAYIGIADVQRRRGSLQDALTTYAEVKARFPRSAFIRNGLASVLAALGQYADAERLLPHHPPASRGEWIAYHIRGMIYLRSGTLNKAAKIFEHGLAENPWPAERSYFQTALAALEIRRKKYQRTLELLKPPTAISMEPVATLIRMHAHGALRQQEELESVYRTAVTPRNPMLLALREDLMAHFRQARFGRSGPTEGALFRRECDALLLAA